MQGQTDVDLDYDGVKESLAIRNALIKEKIDVIFSSPLTRAYKTIQPLARGKNLGITFARHLIERGFGVVEGLQLNDVNKGVDERKNRILQKTTHPNYRPSGGESLIDVQSRVTEFLNFLTSTNLKGIVLCMTHGGVLDILYRILKKKPLSSKRNWIIPNGGFYYLERLDKEFRIIKWAETSHLTRYGTLDEY